MKILIGVPTSGSSRYSDFEDCLDALIIPEGCTIIKRRVPGGSVAKNRNIIIRIALQESCDYLLFLDDDMIFNPNLLTTLLSHNVSVVSGHCLIRYPPFRSSIIDRFNYNNDLVFHDVTGQKGLIQIWATGLACTLLDCKVLGKLNQYTSIGWLHHDELSEDISLFIQLHEINVDTYCDLDCHVGHHINAVLWPNKTITQGIQKVGVIDA